jgi:PhnB protein
MPAGAYRPEGVTTVTVYLTVARGAEAIDFYKRAFSAEERFCSARDDGFIEHATLRIGDSTVYLADASQTTSGASAPETLGGTPVTMYLYVPDCDATWKRAVDAGATIVTPLNDQEWGDRYGLLRDPFGHLWAIATMKPHGGP